MPAVRFFAIKPLRQYFRRRRTRSISLTQFQLSALAMMMGAFVVGCYFTLSQVLIPMIQALTETTLQMPSEVAFDRLAESGLAGHDTGGGATFVLSSEVKLATSSAWWTADYAQKKQLTVRNLSSVPLATQSATTQQITVNTKELYDAGKLQDNCEDLRVVFVATESGSLRQELPRSYYPASGATNCSDSTATTITFPLQEPLWAGGGSDSNYEVYYGNPSATEPGYLDQGYSITRQDGSTASATLVCPFNGTTTCVGGETPTTQTGAIRYSGGKSAMQFSGKNNTNSFLTLANTNSSLHIVDDLTIDVWINIPSGGGGNILGTNGCFDWQQLSVSDSNISYRNYQDGNYWTQSVSHAFTPDTWNHIGVVANKSANEVKIYVNGNLINTKGRDNANWPTSAGNDLTLVGKRCSGSNNVNPFSGYLDELRISNTARYTSNFTPQTTPFEPDEHTKLLLHFDENGDDPRNTGKAIDSSGNGNHGTITGAKYVSGLVGVDNSSSSTGAIPAGASASHQGIFIEEGTTNLVTNPSFEHNTYNTNWGTNYFNYATASATFTPQVAKRNSAGPFASGVMVGGAKISTNNSDVLSVDQGNKIGGTYPNSFYSTFDVNQGSLVLWWTPEFGSADSSSLKAHLFQNATDRFRLYYDYSDSKFHWSVNGCGEAIPFSYSISAGSTYNLVLRWDYDASTLNMQRGALSVNDGHSFSGSAGCAFDAGTSWVGSSSGIDSAQGIIEGLTIYRRPLFDGTYGIDVGNGDEIAQIYNSGTGQDPTLITGSWDVVFALPTNASTGALTSGTGNAWSHPHASNLLYTNTTNTGGFMMNGTPATDGWVSKTGDTQTLTIQPDGALGEDTYINPAAPTANYSTLQAIYITKGGSEHTGLIKFDLSSIPSNATIMGASATFVTKDGWWGSGSLQLNRILNPNAWTENQATYNVRQTGVAWAGSAGASTIGVDYDTDPVGTPVAIPQGEGHVVALNFNANGVSDVQSMLTDNNGFRIKSGSEGSWALLYSSDDTTPANRPKLELSFVAPPMVSVLSTSEKIYSGGYKFTSNAANQGISRSFTATSGGDYVLRALGHSDGTCAPQVKITRADGTTEISHLDGTTSSTRTDPDVYIFTWESPAAEENQIQLINTASSGTCYWHQVEVQSNLINNPSMEGGSGDPWTPTGWSNTSTAGESAQESTIVHSGGSSFKYSTTGSAHRSLTQTPSFTTGKFYSAGGFVKNISGNLWWWKDSSGLPPQTSASYGDPGYSITGSQSIWTRYNFIGRRYNMYSPGPNLQARSGSAVTSYLDDTYLFQLSDVSLTVTPASQANSTETTGLRVDGADTLTQPITGLSADRGVIKFKFTPRHSFAVADKFGSSYPTIATFYADTNNYLKLLRQDASTLRLDAKFNGTQVQANYTSPVLNAGTSYDFELSYTASGSLVLKINGAQVATQSGVVAFGTVPTTAYLGSDNVGSNHYDGTISSFITLTPTENTTAPYSKFGSKSAKLVNAGSTADEYTIAIDPNSTATHTLSAYVYDGTTGNVGGAISTGIAKLVFGGSVVTPSAYTDMGGGWWRLTYSAATTDASLLYGVQAQAGKTIYVDGVQLEQKAYATTYADGSLGTGYSWSGTANASSGVRSGGSGGQVIYPTVGNITSNLGSVSLWLNRKYIDTLDHGWGFMAGYFTVSSGGESNDGNFNILSSGGANINCVWGATNVTTPVDTWHHVVVTWDNLTSTRKCYVDSVVRATQTITTIIETIGIGYGVNWGAIYPSDAVISDLRIFDSALTSQEVANLYQQGLSTHSSGAEAVDRYQASGTYTSPVIDLHANGAWGSVPWSATNALNSGGINYFTRTSMDHVSWSSWTAVTGSVGEGSWTGGIASDPRRYLQWKADITASSDKSQSPVISAMSTTYVEDSTPPANPTQVALGYTNHASSSATLTSNEWYNYATPKFTWEAGLDDPAAGQSSSGIDGYHVFFTTNQAATPSANLANPCYRFAESDDRVFSVGTTPDTCELSDADYYLRMQTKDNSGNVSDPVTLFTYKYDSTAPRSPVSVSSTTVGYTSQNEFSFYWPAASDQGLNQSGLAYYEYKTGATEGPYSTWTKSNEPGDPLVTLASNITAYQEGQNFFFVRTVDFAGNVSAEISNLGVSPFYYNESAPTAPVNVVISPVTSSDAQALENIFTVTWDKPASYSGELAKYYYCVNCTPSVETMTETTNSQTADRTLTNIALATQQGKNTFYLVAEDNNINTDTGRGNVNFEAYATAEFYASTIAPGAPTNLTISDASDRDAEVWRLTLAWKQAVTGGTPNFYAIHRSTDGTTFTKIGETTSTAYTDADLTQSQEYSYKVFAIDNANSTSLSSNIVTLAPEGKYTTPPLAGGTPNVAVGSTVATITWSTGRIAYGAVEYGKTTSYESSVAETVAVGNHSIKLTGLTPGTVYHYRVQALDDSILMGYDREIAYSSDYTFTTSALPTISNVEVTDLTLASAIINWSAVSLSSATIEYGESTAYGASVSVGVGSSGTYSTKLSGLKDSVTYHFRIRAVDIDGTDITSDDYTFTTLTFPKVTAVVFKTDQAQNATAINVAWSTNVPTTASVEYQAVKIDPSFASQSEINYSNSSVLQGLSQTELARLPVVPLGSPQYLDRSTISNRHVVQITNLSDSSLYVFTIRGRDEYGNQAVSDPIRYVTGADTKPPSVENLVIETPIVGEGVESKAEIVLSFTTDEPAFSQVLWGAGTGSEYPQATQTSSEATTDHMIVLRDLDPTSTYHLKIKTTDQTGNTSETEDTVVVTPTAQAAAFELILKNLEGIFGFLGLQ